MCQLLQPVPHQCDSLYLGITMQALSINGLLPIPRPIRYLDSVRNLLSTLSKVSKHIEKEAASIQMPPRDYNIDPGHNASQHRGCVKMHKLYELIKQVENMPMDLTEEDEHLFRAQQAKLQKSG